MRICGLQKLALVDFPGRLAATVFTGGCNLRCPFCHNALLVTQLGQNPEEHSLGEVLAFLETRRGLLDGVVLSGGEPLMQEGVAEFFRAVKALGFSTKLDTNGCYPEKLQALLDGGLLDYVAMDIKNCLPKYPLTAGVPTLDTEPVQQSVRVLKEGRVPYEFRTTLVREFHTEADLLAIAHWLTENGNAPPRYVLQTFVDSGGLIGSGLTPFTAEEMQAFAGLLSPFFPQVTVRGV